MAKFTAGANAPIDFLTFDVKELFTGTTKVSSPTDYTLDDAGDANQFKGTGFKYDLAGKLISGTIQEIVVTDDVAGTLWSASGFSLSVTTANNLLAAEDDQGFLGAVFAGKDTLAGSPLDDRLFGYKGNDTIDGGVGADTMDGGIGNDTYVVDSAGDAVAETGGAGTDLVQSTAAAYTLANGSGIENLTLLDGAVNGTGNDANNAVTGNGGANALAGAAGKDTLTGNDGDDTLDGGKDIDRLVGGKGNDTYVVDDAKDVISETLTLAALGGIDLVRTSVTLTLGANLDNLQLTGNDTLAGTGNALANELTGNSGANKLSGMAGNDSLLGNGGNDTLDGGAGDDTMAGGEADDLYIADTLGDVDNIKETGANVGLGDELKTNQLLTGLVLGIEHYTFTGSKGIVFSGRDAEANRLTGTAAADTLAGLGGNDTLIGLGGNDKLEGGDGSDSLDGGAGNDTMAGGKGDDIYVVSATTDVVDEIVGEGTDKIQSTVTYSLAAPSAAGIENLELLGAGAINATGNAGKNELIGNTGANKLDGGGEADTMIGGKGSDIYFVDDLGDKVTELFNEGTDLVNSSVDFTLTPDLENLILTGTASKGTGNDGANTITGNDLDNILNGGKGIDKLIGGKGDDTYVVDEAKDVVTEAAGGGVDLVRTSVAITLGSNVEDLELIEGNVIDGTGNTLANTLTGNNQANKLLGMTGDDELIGAGGNDTLDGGAGNDSMTGGEGDDLYIQDSLNDKITEGGTSLGDKLQTNQQLTDTKNTTGIEHYVFTGKAVGFTGDGAANSITGTTAADTLTGDGGNDTLDGGKGIDKMFGGLGDDVYGVDSTSDEITDTDGTKDEVLASVTYVLKNGGGIENLSLSGTAAINATGNADANVITGNTSNNKLDGGGGSDVLKGRNGNDTYTVDGGDTVEELADEGTDLVNSSVDFVLGDHVENLTITGSAGRSGTGNALANVLTGGSGADSLFGGDKADTLTGNDGADTLDGGTGDDKLVGGKGDDFYIVDSDKDVISETLTLATGGKDTVQTSSDYVLGANLDNLILIGDAAVEGTGNALGNVITANGAHNLLDGLGGFDVIDGGAGNDTINAGDGGDTIIGGSGTDIVIFSGLLAEYKLNQTLGTVLDQKVTNGNDGEDNLSGVEILRFKDQDVSWDVPIQEGTSGNDTPTLTDLPDGFDGLAGDDSLAGLGGSDTLIGGADGDTIAGGSENDVLEGGLGTDLYVYSPVDGGKDTVQTGEDGLDSVALQGTLFDWSFQRIGNDLFITGLTDAIDTFDANNAIRIIDHYAGSAIKHFQGDFGSATNLFYGGNAALTTVFTTVGLTGKDQGANAELVVGGVATNDSMTGGGGQTDFLFGLGGNDTIDGESTAATTAWLSGGDGSDSLIGGAGDDNLRGDAGNDTLDGGAGLGDRVDYASAADDVTVDLSQGKATNDGFGNLDVLTNIENVRGSKGNDALIGNGGDNELEGGDGNDTLDAGSGNDLLSGASGFDALQGGIGDDTLIGGAGADTLDGSGGTDFVSYVDDAAGVIVNLSSATFMGVLAGRALSGPSFDTLLNISGAIGSAFNDTIVSGANDETFDGGAGADIAVFAGKFADYSIVTNAGVTTVTDLQPGTNGNDGTDTITTVEHLQFSDKTVTIINTAPTITSNGGGATAPISIAENTTAVTTVTATDPDTDQTRTFSISGGADAAKFTINPSSGVLSFIAAPDFENPTDAGANNTYVVDVRVSDGAGGVDTQTITVTVTDANDAPAITSDGGKDTATITLAEGIKAVTDVNATDADKQTLTYSLAGGKDQADFTIDATTGELTFVATPDFELPADSNGDNSYEVIVQASDGKGGTDTQTLTVNVTDVNEAAPVITSNDGGPTAAITVAENQTAVTDVNATDQDKTAVLTYSLVGGADKGLFTINGSTGVLSFVSAPNFEAPADVGGNNVYDVIVQASDGTFVDTQEIAVTVTNVNEPPAITSNGGNPTAAVSIAENTTAVADVNATDPDAGTTLVYSISGGVDASKFSIDSVSGALSFVTAPNFEAPTDTGGNNVYDVIVQAKDGSLTDTQAIAVTVTDANEAPNITSTAFSINENTIVVGTVVATDPDGDKLTYSISGGVDQALFNIDSLTGALSFKAAPDFDIPADNGANNIYDIVVKVSDGSLSDTQAIAVTVKDVNEAPEITSTAFSINENTTSVGTVIATDQDGDKLTYSISGGIDQALFNVDSLTGALSFKTAPDFDNPVDSGANNVYDVIVKVTDGSLSDTQAIAITVKDVNEAPEITSTAFSINENAMVVGTVIAADPDGDKLTYSISGGVDQALFNIDSLTGALSFKAAPDFEIPADNGANNIYDIVVKVSDGSLSDTQAIAVTVKDINEAPEIASTAFSINENTTAVGTVIATDQDGDKLTYSISGGADQSLFNIDSLTGALSFKAAPDFDSPADSGANNVYDIIVKVTDGSLSDTQAIAVTVKDVNEAPDITSTAFSINENTTAVGTVIAADPDGDKLTYSISGGVDQALFNIDSLTGALSFKAAPDFDSPADSGANNIYDVIVKVSDGSLLDTQAITVTVKDVNEAPEIASTAFSINENATVVGTVIAADQDGDKLTYSISGGIDQALFNIDSLTGALSFKAAPDFDDPADDGANNIYDIVVKVTDGSLSDMQAIAITVKDVNEAPEIASTAFSIKENTTTVGTVIATDQDGDKLTYSISGGVDQTLFNIDSLTGALSFKAAPDFDSPADNGANNVYDLIVKASDGSLSDTQAITVTVTNSNEAPNITSTAFSINENTTVVGTVIATDQDGDKLTYSISGGVDQSLFNIDSLTGALSFKTAPDFDSPADDGANNIYDLIVKVTDGTLSDTQAMAVTIKDVNEAPEITSTAFSINENTTVVGTVIATDQDGDKLTYSISGGVDQALFNIDSLTGALSFKAAPDFDNPADNGANNVYDLIVKVTDGSLSDTQAMAVTVKDVNEAPEITSTAFSLDENLTAVGTIAALDQDGDKLTYSISGGLDQALFNIDSLTGALSFKTAPDFDDPADNGANNVYDVIVKVSDGSLSDTQVIAVTVKDVNEAPKIASTAFSLDENTTAVGIVAATDEDGDKLTYSINGGVDAALFNIDSLTGALSFKVAPNFENPGDDGDNNVYDLIVKATDGGLSDTQAITVTVDDVNEVPNITSTAFSLNENSTAVGTVLAAEPDGDKLTYSISGGIDQALFNIDSLSGALSFKAAPDFENPGDDGDNNVYDLIVKVSDGSLSDTQAITVTVNDVNEAPNITTTALSLNENTTAAGTVAATDPETDKLTYSISGGVDKDLFLIDSDTGALSFKVAPDFEDPADVGTNNVYNIDIHVTDGTLTDTQAIMVTVTDVNPENITGNANANKFTGGAGNDTISGLGDNDTLIGGGGNDSLSGGDDDDTLNGGTNNDTLVGGPGADSLDGGDGIDLVTYQAAGGGVTVALSENSTNPDGDGGGQDTLTNIENVRGSDFGDSIAGDSVANSFEGSNGDDTLIGSGGDDSLVGGNDNDMLVGSDDNDTLLGGAGADTLTGGNGSDLLDYDSIAEAGDFASDFEIGAGKDVINIADILVGYTGDGSDLDDLGFVELVGDAGATTLRVDVDGSAGSGAVFVDLAILDGVDVNSVSVDTLVTDGNLIPT